MTVSFYKLQVSGDDFVLVDLDKASHRDLSRREGALAELAAAILDRRRGVGGRAVVYAGGAPKAGAGSLPLRVFAADGREDYSGGDALLCAARWAFDSGRAGDGKIRLILPGGERTLTALDSRSFALELDGPRALAEAPVDAAHGASGPAGPDAGNAAGPPIGPDGGDRARIDLIVDGRAAAAYLFALDRSYAVAVASVDGPGPKRVRTALAALFPAAAPVVVRPAGRDLVRFSAAEGADRVSSAAAAMAASALAGRTDGEAAAEWRGRGGAIAYAHFGTGEAADAEAAPPGIGRAALLDRGRFWVEWRSGGRILVVGVAEYSFEGNYDYFIEEG